MTNIPEVSTADLLSFHDSELIDIEPNSRTIPAEGFAQSSGTEKVNLGEESFTNQQSTETSEKSFWSIEYYQQFYDIDTQDVLNRIAASFIPKFDGSSRLTKHKPDLYGPLWISLTLIVTIAVGGNISNYLQNANSNFHWRYNFELVSYAATTICLYIAMMPFIIWLLLKSNTHTGIDSENTAPGFLELFCIYGYSLFIFIPLSIFYLIQVKIVQWSLALIGALLSVTVLLLRLVPALRSSKYRIVCVLIILIFHFALATGFMLFFFHVPDVYPVPHTNGTIVNSTVVNSSVVNATASNAAVKNAVPLDVIPPHASKTN